MAIAGSGRSQRTLNWTPNTGEGWGSLLGVLTDEELGQYAQVATDQIAREVRWWWLHALMVVSAVALAGWVGIRWFSEGLGIERLVYGIGAVLFLAYWPYRSAKTKRLWREHRNAVEGELARRKGS